MRRRYPEFSEVDITISHPPPRMHQVPLIRIITEYHYIELNDV